MRLALPIIMAIVLLIGLSALIIRGLQQAAGPATSPLPQNPVELEAIPPERQVVFNESGVDRQLVTIKAGEKIAFINNDSWPHQPASDPHPFHTRLPGFDPKRVLLPGDFFIFQFNQVGEFTFHDHSNPLVSGLRGTVVVVSSSP